MITLYQAYSEQDEARFIAEVIKGWMNSGELYKDCAVVYRSNAQSRAIEEALLRISIPYRIYGGLRFYERLEIKNAMSFLKVILIHMTTHHLSAQLQIHPEALEQRR